MEGSEPSLVVGLGLSVSGDGWFMVPLLFGQSVIVLLLLNMSSFPLVPVVLLSCREGCQSVWALEGGSLMGASSSLPSVLACMVVAGGG